LFCGFRVHIISSIAVLLFYLQKFIEAKVGPDEKLPWVQSVIRKGFTGESRLI
jgi:hypothetical protein